MSCWATTARSVSPSTLRMPSCSLAGKTLMMRSTVLDALFVCRVPKTIVPFSAAERAMEIVSRSRISPTRTRSGSSRPADLSASAKPVAWVPISRWWMRHFLFACTNSIGSSIVMTW